MDSEYKPITSALKALSNIDRNDLVTLLGQSKYKLVSRADNWWGIETLVVELMSPSVFTHALRTMQEHDINRILEAIVATDQEIQPTQLNGSSLSFVEDILADVSPVAKIYPELIINQHVMIDVATGGEAINNVNDYYKARTKRLHNTLESIGIPYINPHEDLWDLYRTWKEKFPTYAERRKYIRDMHSETISAALHIVDTERVSSPREPTGWERVDRTLSKCHAKLQQAIHEEDFQEIGLLCREVFISLGQAVYDSETQTPSDGVAPSSTDAYRMLDAYISTTLSGSKVESIRKHAKTSLQLAVELQHKRTADFRLSAVCLEATSSMVNLIAIFEGKSGQCRGDRL